MSTKVIPAENEFSEVALNKLPTLAVGQCCSLKVDAFPVRVWVCRMGNGVTVETYNPVEKRWDAKGGCV